VESFLKMRAGAVGSLSLTVQENRPGSVLRETRRDMVAKYVHVMAPKLRNITDGVLRSLFEKGDAMVRRGLGGRIGTDCPTDLFSLMSEHLKLAKSGGSLSLQRKLLSLLMGEVASYGSQVLWHVSEMWRTHPADVSIDFVIAAINDAGTMMDLLEQLEADFAPALQEVSEAADTELARMSSRIEAGGGAGAAGVEKDEFDREEEEQARVRNYIVFLCFSAAQ